MPEDRATPSAREVVDALLTFAEDPEDIVTMTHEEVRAYLDEEGISLDAHKQRMRQMMVRVRGQERLARASEQRHNLEATERPRPKGTGFIPDLRAEVARQIERLNQRHPLAAGMFARKFEQATDSDLQAILDDLQYLEETGGTGDDGEPA